MSEIIFCKNCQKNSEISDDCLCPGCGENICKNCGCTDSEACLDDAGEPCGWVGLGHCSGCFFDKLPEFK